MISLEELAQKHNWSNRISWLYEFEEIIESWKKDNLSSYCINNCQTTCCEFMDFGHKLGFINEQDIRTMFRIPENVPLDEKTLGYPIISKEEEKCDESVEGEAEYIVVTPGEMYYPVINRCPSSHNGICLIHENPVRPDVCSEYPILIAEAGGIFGLHIYLNCPATNDPSMHKLLKTADSIGLIVINYKLPSKQSS